MKTGEFSSYWKNLTPISFLSCAGLLVMSSSRLAHAIITAGSLLWVFCLSSIAISLSNKFLPKIARPVLFAFISSFFAGLYLFLLWIISPLFALEIFFIITLSPMVFIAQGANKHSKILKPAEALSSSLFEALVPGILIIIFALIREPLGFMSLSVPAGRHGIIFLFSADSEAVLQIHIIASSGGALLLLGYFLGLYGYFNKSKKTKEGNK